MFSSRSMLHSTKSSPKQDSDFSTPKRRNPRRRVIEIPKLSEMKLIARENNKPLNKAVFTRPSHLQVIFLISFQKRVAYLFI